MLMGSYVKAINAGLACPDWPLCFDQVYPTDLSKAIHTFDQVMAEYFHRVFALVVSLMIVVLLILSYFHRKDLGYENESIGQKRFQVMILSTVLLLIQVIFGALTVILKLQPAIVSIHLGVATLILVGTIFNLTWIRNKT